MRIVNRNITFLHLKEEQNSTNVLEVSLVINHYDMSRSLKWRAQRRKERQENSNQIIPQAMFHNHKLEALYLQRHLLDELIRKNKSTISLQLKFEKISITTKLSCLYSPNIKQDITTPPYI